MTTNRVTVTTGTYNRLPLLTAMIESARAAFPLDGLDFVIVDGGSTDGTPQYCASQSDVTFIQQGTLKGAISAFNEGASAARGDYVVLANDDVTFLPDSLLRAYTFLEDNPDVGAVAFMDNRATSARQEVEDGYGIQFIDSADGKAYIYPQVGMVRRWVGELAGFWGRDDALFLQHAHTYGGDSYLGARIYELGYRIEMVTACKVNDHIHPDNLRERNLSHELHGTSAYYSRYPNGFTRLDKPVIPPRDTASPRILYMPVYEAGYLPIQKAGKFGLRAALQKRATVMEVDYVNAPFDLPELVRAFRPDILLTQVHGIDRLTTDMIYAARIASPDTLILNWCGDVWRRCYLEGGMKEYNAACDLSLGVNADALAEVRGIDGAQGRYWQNAFEYATDKELSDEYNVLFLGSFYKGREGLRDYLSSVDAKVSGSGWTFPVLGNTTYQFQKARDLYRSSKVTISDNVHKARGFVSDRIWSALAAGGALLLQERVDGLDDLTGLRAGEHYIEYATPDDLPATVEYWLNPKRDKQRRKIVDAGMKYVRECHSFDNRVDELFEIIRGLG